MKPSRTIDWKAARARLADGERRLEEVLRPSPDAIRRMLEERAATLRARRSVTVEKTIALVIASLGSSRYAIPATAAAEIARVETITPVPGAAILGIIAVRGEFFSLISAVASPAGGATETVNWAIILRHPRHRTALAFTRLEAIAEVPETAVAQRGANDVIQARGELATFLDAAAIFQRFETGYPQLSL